MNESEQNESMRADESVRALTRVVESEPSYAVWEHCGLPCLIARNPIALNLNGYVGVPPGHWAYGKHYGAVDVEVHGGITFGADHAPTMMIENIPDELREFITQHEGYWWLGFDTVHAEDLAPGLVLEIWRQSGRVPMSMMDQEYRNIHYVREECEKLAEQLRQPRLESGE